MKQKEKNKNNLFQKLFSKKRIIFSLVFLCLASVFFLGYFNNAYAASTFTSSIDPVLSKGASVVVEAMASPFLAAMNALLYATFAFFGLLLVIAGILLDWAINPVNFNAVMNLDSIRLIWTTVRDFLNIFFIMVLLFSAFCTIFQVSKYSIKSIMLNLVIMALLVNFSFPIARFIIDAANVPMYYIINNTVPGLSNSSGISTLLVSFTKIIVSIIPEPKFFSWGEGPMGSQLTIKLIAANIFVFILTISILIMGILFIVRMIVLAIVVIFSPVGFAASIFPGTDSFAKSWWDTLFKQAFWGPIMAFMLYVALKMMNEIQNGQVGTSMDQIAQQNGGSFSKIIIGGVSMAIPVALIWIGMGTAKKMGAMGADKVQKLATKAVNWAARAPLKYSGVEGGLKKAADHYKKKGAPGILGKFPGLRGSDKLEENEAGVAGFLTGDKNIVGGLHAKRVKEAAEKHDTSNMSEGDLKALAANGNIFERGAAIQELANRGKATASQLDNIRNVFGETSQVFRQLQNKVKTYDPVSAFHHLSSGHRENAIRDFVNSNQFDIKKVGSSSLGNQEFMEILFETDNITTKEIADLSKDAIKRTAINASINNLVSVRNDNSVKADREIHMAHFNQTGDIANGAFVGGVNGIFKNMDKDSASRMTITTVNNYNNEIAENINSGQYKDIIRNMKNNNAREALNEHISGATFAAGSNGATVQRIIHNDPYLNNL